MAVVTAAGVIGAPVAWAAKRRYNGYQIRKTVAKGLCAELDDTTRALDGTSCHHQIKISIIDPKSNTAIKTCKKIRCTLTFLNHDAYDGFLHAGHLTALDTDLALDVQNVYMRVKYHNRWLDHLMPLLDRELETGKANVAVTSTYYDILDKHESELLEKIPVLKKRLEGLASLRFRFGRRSCQA